MPTQIEEHRQRGIADGHAAALECFNALLRADMKPAVAAKLRAEQVAATIAVGAAMRERGDTVDAIEAYASARQDAFEERFAAYARPFAKFAARISGGPR